MTQYYHDHDYDEILCLGCPRNVIRKDTDENGLCPLCAAEQFAVVIFSGYPDLVMDDTYAALLDFAIELHPPEEAARCAFDQWQAARSGVAADVQRMVS